MTNPTQPIPTQRRISSAPIPLAIRVEPKATTAQSLLEYTLFAIVGLTIVIAAIALFVTNSAEHRRVPNLVADGIEADRVNLLIIGTTPNGTANLPTASAIMLLSVKPSTRQAVLTSIPRDLWVKLATYGTRRLAAAPAVGLTSGYPGQAAGLTTDTVSYAIGQPVHAFIGLENARLAKTIDALGGIDLNVEQTVYEFRHRDRFMRGPQHFDGQRALRYAYSPFVIGPAADRFARESRQREITAAVLAKASNSSGIETLSKRDSDETNLTREQMAWLGKTLRSAETRRVTLAPYMEVIQVATYTDDGEAVQPRGGDLGAVRRAVSNIFMLGPVASH